MRLWHYKLIPYLPRQQLLGQHRECAALRGRAGDANMRQSIMCFGILPIILLLIIWL